MAQIPTYVARSSVETGPVQSDAPLSVFGAQQGGAMQNIGAGLQDVASILEKRRREGEQIWVDNTMTDAEIQWNKQLEDAKNNAGDGAPNFTGNVLKSWDQFQSDTLKNAPTGSSQRLLDTHLNNLRQKVTEHAQIFEAQERVAKQVNDVEYGLNQKVALAALDPTQTTALMNSAAGAVGTIQGLAPSSKVDAMSRKGQEDIFAASIIGQFGRKDFSGALARLTEKDSKGEIIAAKYLGPKYVGLLHEAQSHAADAHALAAWGAKDTIEGALAQVKAGKGMPAGVDTDRLSRTLGGSEDQIQARKMELDQKFQIANTIGNSVSAIQFAPPEKVQQVLAAIAPVPRPVEGKYGLRNDGITPKGSGWQGEIPTSNGQVMTELSIGMESNGKIVDVPAIVPATTKAELDYLSQGGNPNQNPDTQKKAFDFAKERIAKGLSPFKEDAGYPNAILRDAKGNLVESLLNYKDQEEVYKEVATFAAHSQKAFQEDRNGYVQQDPVIKAAYTVAEKAFDSGDSNAPALMEDAIRQSMVKQQSMGATSYELEPLSKGQLVRVAAELNGQDVSNLRPFIQSLQARYRGYTDEILSAATRLPAGQAADFRYVYAAKNVDNSQAFTLLTNMIRETKAESDLLDKELVKRGDLTTLKTTFRNQTEGPGTPADNVAKAMNVATGGVLWGQGFTKLNSDLAKYIYIKGDAKSPEDATKFATAMLVDQNYAATPTVNGKPFLIPARNSSGISYTPDELLRIKANAENLPREISTWLSSTVQAPLGQESNMKDLRDKGIWVTKKDHLEFWIDGGPTRGRGPVYVKDGKAALEGTPGAKPLSYPLDSLARHLYPDVSVREGGKIMPGNSFVPMFVPY